MDKELIEDNNAGQIVVHVQYAFLTRLHGPGLTCCISHAHIALSLLKRECVEMSFVFPIPLLLTSIRR